MQGALSSQCRCVTPAVAARTSNVLKNSTLMDQAGQLLAWVKSASLLTSDYTINDGLHTAACNTVISDQWSYNVRHRARAGADSGSTAR